MKALPLAKGTAVIFGAASSLARGISWALAKRGFNLILAGRDESELSSLCSDVSLRFGVKAEPLIFDALNHDSLPEVWNDLAVKAPDLKGCVLVFGFMGEQEEMSGDPIKILPVLNSNYTGACLLAQLAAKTLEERKEGWIIGISSVAGDRGRMSNYVYGSAKGGFTLFLQGLRARLQKVGVPVLTVKPGFLDTPMTFGKKGVFLAGNPWVIGEKVIVALEKGKDTVYLPGFWKLIMTIIKSVPEKVFKKTKM